jgi:EAL domain-containing protein (putative c-di-GMP-specific phosphodiesterase class I)
MDIQRYARRQNIYRHASDQLSGKSVWQSVAEEYYISFEDLRRDRFPKLEIITPEHLFLALCETLDHNLIAALTQDIDAILARPVHLNMSVASVAGAAFAQFTHVVPNTKRSSITLELHRGDLFQDFAVTLGAIETLRREGFKVALDAITPDLAAYIDFAAFGVDYIKINVSRERADQLGQAGTRKRLESIPPERLIFFRCDNEKALATGLDLGVSLFQGWLIDDLLAK